ncbi:dynein, axonemal, heavy chain 12 [Plakobranchus ocellatus]|uniref:Dynein, axonemal, heavy chain 12 n=1 Tax=Plakobranchus ocellatus TaxID=259542 RepID=A0AAV4B5A8_9GAST|nr:dynein, axonemal, heavy chain 12 [Plakobranchus ocellatus]
MNPHISLKKHYAIVELSKRPLEMTAIRLKDQDKSSPTAGTHPSKLTNLNILLESGYRLVTGEDGGNTGRICRKFEHFKEKAETIPKTTDELFALSHYMEEVRTKKMSALRQRVQDSASRLMYLIDRFIFNEADMAMNSQVLTWPDRIMPIFDANDVMMEEARRVGELKMIEARNKLVSDLARLRHRVEEFCDYGELSMIQHYAQDTRTIQRKLAELAAQIEWIHKEEGMYKFPTTEYPEWEAVSTALEPFSKFFSTVLKWHRCEKRCMDGDFLNQDVEAIASEIDEYSREIYKTQKIFALRLKKMQMDYDDEEREVKKQQRAELAAGKEVTIPDLEPFKVPEILAVIDHVHNAVTDFKEIIPTIGVMCNPGLRKRHWDAMSEVAGFDLTPDAGTTLRKVLKLDLEPFMEKFEAISTSASKEFTLEKAFRKMTSEWEDMCLSLNPHKGDSSVVVLGGVDDIQTLLDDHIVKTQTMRNSPFVKPFEKDVKVLVACTSQGVLEKLKDTNALLDAINKGLNAYLEKKRLYFPRFFFLSNDEMLEILSETKDPTRVQPHLKKCFEGIAKLEFDKDLVIHGMFSSEGENIQFSYSIDTKEAKGSVEKWLLQVQNVMLTSVRDVIEESYEDHQNAPRKSWVQEWPGQVVICVSSIYWTLEVHEAIALRSEGLRTYHSTLNDQLKDVVDLVRGKLTTQQRISLGALVVIDVHARDVVMDMAEKGVCTQNDFNWLAQLRYYWEDANCLVRITNATVKYAYEYLGNTGRLVITPLTDRCYRTLAAARLPMGPGLVLGAGSWRMVDHRAPVMMPELVCSAGWV